jgi:Fic family protein
MRTIFEILRNLREEKAVLLREVAAGTQIDMGLLSKIERGDRLPTRDQLIKLADFYKANYREMMIAWLSDKVVYELKDDETALEAIKVAEQKISYLIKHADTSINYPVNVDELVKAVDSLKNELNLLRQQSSYKVAEALELEYTYDSNRIEGNTLTIRETELVINQGLTVAGKTMREHLEAINHKEAIDYIKDIAERKIDFSERVLLDIHSLILQNIDRENSGRYRSVQVMIQGSKHIPPQPWQVAKLMEDYFIWYRSNKNNLHPLILAAELHERLVSIHPFIDGNGRTARLVMNLVMIRGGYVICNIKGDTSSRLSYYDALEKCQVNLDKTDFLKFIIENELSALNRYLSIIKG